MIVRAGDPAIYLRPLLSGQAKREPATIVESDASSARIATWRGVVVVVASVGRVRLDCPTPEELLTLEWPKWPSK